MSINVKNEEILINQIKRICYDKWVITGTGLLITITLAITATQHPTALNYLINILIALGIEYLILMVILWKLYKHELNKKEERRLKDEFERKEKIEADKRMWNRFIKWNE